MPANFELNAIAVPTGGAITLSISGDTNTSTVLARSSGGVSGVYQDIYAGVTTPIYIDAGDGQASTLSSGVTYCYRLTATAQQYFSQEVVLPNALNIKNQDLLPLMQKLLQGGINNLVVPNGVNKISNGKVLIAMPLQGAPPLPIVTINQDLIQQHFVPIGQQFENVNIVSGEWTVTSYATRKFRITVMADNTTTRDFYRDAIIAIFQALLTTTFAPIGLDNSHRFQAFSAQVADDPTNRSPAFYYADIMVELDGTMNVGIYNTYGTIETISVTTAYGDGVQDTVTVAV